MSTAMLGSVSPFSKSVNTGVVLGTVTHRQHMTQAYFTLEKPRDLNELWIPSVVLPVINESSK